MKSAPLLSAPASVLREAFRDAERLLRGGGGLAGGPAAPGARPLFLAGYILGGGLLYGAVMGTFSGGSGPEAIGPRPLQVLYSASKVPLLLGVAFLVTLPSFFVLNTLLGLRDDFRASLRALVATQASLSLVLASLAPYTLLWYASSGDYPAALLFNAAMFGLASLAGQWLLRREYRPLIAKHPRHKHLLRAWLVIYAFVGIQMGWVLRPFVGHPDQPTRFFREDSWGNAYVVVAKLVWRVLGG